MYESDDRKIFIFYNYDDFFNFKNKSIEPININFNLFIKFILYRKKLDSFESRGFSVVNDIIILFNIFVYSRSFLFYIYYR